MIRVDDLEDDRPLLCLLLLPLLDCRDDVVSSDCCCSPLVFLRFVSLFLTLLFALLQPSPPLPKSLPEVKLFIASSKLLSLPAAKRSAYTLSFAPRCKRCRPCRDDDDEVLLFFEVVEDVNVVAADASPMLPSTDVGRLRFCPVVLIIQYLVLCTRYA